MANKKKKTTMSVREMGDLLGLKKTDRYWLVHKQEFQVINVDGKMRVDLESFERWYANQTHYRKVTGEEPGRTVAAESYSIQEVADLLGVCKASAYEILINHAIETITVNFHKRVPKAAFQKWYASQCWYRTPEDRARDRPMEEASISMPEFGRMLCLDRRETYVVLSKIASKLDFIVIAERKRITKESFERWYASQSTYVKVSDRPLAEQRRIAREYGRKQAESLMPRPKIPTDKALYTPRELAVLLDVTEKEVYNMLKREELPARKISGRFWISRESLQSYLTENNIILDEWMEE